jgi:hypothetical protein
VAGRLPYAWGATDTDLARRYPADTVLGVPVTTLTRAIHVDAPQELTWRWLCQIAVAPYSYDWIDNRGRQSPQELIPGVDRLEVGQRMAFVFELVSFDAPHQWTGVTVPAGERMFGRVAMTYAAEPEGSGSRIVGRLAVPLGGPVSRLRTHLLAWGDLVMMRRQFLNFKALAERDALRG